MKVAPHALALCATASWNRGRLRVHADGMADRCGPDGSCGHPRRRRTSAPRSTRSRSRSHLARSSDDGDEPAPETHPAVRAFRRRGRRGPLCRALADSGRARARVLGRGARRRARSPRACSGAAAPRRAPELLRDATELEGHADNVAASLLGGVVAVAGGPRCACPLGRELAVVVWVPERETATASARRLLPEQVPFDDAVFNVGRTALLVAALAAGDATASAVATEDRLHQDRRLARRPRRARRDRRRARGRGVCRVAVGLGPVGGRVRRSAPAPGDIAAALPERADVRMVLADRRRGSPVDHMKCRRQVRRRHRGRVGHRRRAGPAVRGRGCARCRRRRHPRRGAATRSSRDGGLGVRCDVTKEADIRALVDAAEERVRAHRSVLLERRHRRARRRRRVRPRLGAQHRRQRDGARLRGARRSCRA